MARAKGAPIIFDGFESMQFAWDSLNGRFIAKKKGVSTPPGFVAPRNYLWIIQRNPSLSQIGEPFAKKQDALREAARIFS